MKSPSPATEKPDWGIMTILAMSMLLASLGTSIANIALPTLAKAFSAPFSVVQGVVVAYLAALTVSAVAVGRLGDIFGLRRMHIAGLTIFAVASLLCGLAPDIWFLIGARALQGVGAAFLMTLSMALMRELAGKDCMGRAMGLLGTVSALGTALGPTLGGALIPAAGWRGIFLVQVPLTVLTLILAFNSLPTGPARKDPAARLDLRAALDRNLMPSLVINALVAATMMTTLVVGPFYLALSAGLREALVGLVMSVGPAIAIVSGLPAGRAVDMWGERGILWTGLTALAAGSLLLSVLPGMIGIGGYVLAIAVLTPGYQLFQTANNTAVLAEVPAERRGLTSGLLSLSRNIGLIAGASVMGAVFAFGVGTEDFTAASPAAIIDGMRLTFAFALAMMALALLIASRFR